MFANVPVVQPPGSKEINNSHNTEEKKNMTAISVRVIPYNFMFKILTALFI